jgi:hypothetical protein
MRAMKNNAFRADPGPELQFGFDNESRQPSGAKQQADWTWTEGIIGFEIQNSAEKGSACRTPLPECMRHP